MPDGLYDHFAHLDCLPQPEEPDDEATLIVTQADERLRRGQELTKILMNNLGVNPFRVPK